MNNLDATFEQLNSIVKPGYITQFDANGNVVFVKDTSSNTNDQNDLKTFRLK